MSNEGEYVEQDNLYSRRPHPDAQGEPLWHDESGIIVFGGGRGCSGIGCLIWLVISVALSLGLTVLLNLMLWLFSGSPPGIPLVDV